MDQTQKSKYKSYICFPVSNNLSREISSDKLRACIIVTLIPFVPFVEMLCPPLTFWQRNYKRFAGWHKALAPWFSSAYLAESCFRLPGPSVTLRLSLKPRPPALHPVVTTAVVSGFHFPLVTSTSLLCCKCSIHKNKIFNFLSKKNLTFRFRLTQ